MRQRVNDEFKKILAGLKLRRPVTEIAEMTGFSKSVVSEIYNDKREASDNFLRILKSALSNNIEQIEQNSSNSATEQFASHNTTQADQITGMFSQMIESLNKLLSTTSAAIENNTTLTQSIDRTTQTNAELVNMLKSERLKPVDDFSKNISEIEEKMTKQSLMIAKAGTVGWESEHQALREIHTFLYDIFPAGESKDKEASGRKRGST